VQDTSWNDVLAVVLHQVRQADWLPSRWQLIALAFPIATALLRVLWERHRRHQQVAIVDAIVTRWITELDTPFDRMPLDDQLAAIARLRDSIVGTPVVVLHHLLLIRVALETCPIDDRVLAALDHLTQAWYDKLPSARKRHQRRLRALAQRDVERLKGRLERERARAAVRQSP
jgi:uncharacterized protein YPO0396